MDPQVQQAIRNINKANRRMLVAMGTLMLASLSATHALRELTQEVTRNGGWKEATTEEAKEVEEELASMVATYEAQVN